MDKVKLVLKFLKKQHFWFLLGLVVIVSGYSWWSARGALATAFLKNKSEIEDRKGKARNVAGIKDHPNTEHHKKADEYIASHTKDVAAAWTKNFDKQGKDILTWPAELRPEFIDLVKDLRPIEPKLADPKFRELPTKYLERYRNYIQYELPKLAEIVGAKWAPTETGGPGGSGGVPPPPGGPVENKVYLVDWLPADQTQWQSGHFDWSKKSTQLPTTREVLYAQEDLWVLKALLTIIKQVNGNIDQPHLSTIKTIDFIHIGREAATTEGSVVKLAPGEAGAAGAGGEGARLGAGPVPPGGAALPAGSGPVPGAQPVVPGGPLGLSGEGGRGVGGVGQADLVGNNRYVDDKYQPLTAAQLAAIGQTNDQASAHLAVAKRMPVRLRVQMDTRRVHKLLTECANSPLTVEVRQLRVNPEKATKGSAGGGASRGVGGGVEGGGGVRADIATAGKAVSPYDGTVEIYGIIYIYNPVPTALAEAMKEVIVAAGGEVKPAADATGTAAPAATGAAAPAGGTTPAPATGAAPGPATGASPAPATPAAESKGDEKSVAAPEANKAGAAGSTPAALGATPAPAAGATAAPTAEKAAAKPAADDLTPATPAAPAKN